MQVRTFLNNRCSDFNKLSFCICSKNFFFSNASFLCQISVIYIFYMICLRCRKYNIFSQFFGAANFTSLIFEKLILLDQLCSLIAQVHR